MLSISSAVCLNNYLLPNMFDSLLKVRYISYCSILYYLAMVLPPHPHFFLLLPISTFAFYVKPGGHLYVLHFTLPSNNKGDIKEKQILLYFIFPSFSLFNYKCHYSLTLTCIIQLIVGHMIDRSQVKFAFPSHELVKK